MLQPSPQSNEPGFSSPPSAPLPNSQPTDNNPNSNVQNLTIPTNPQPIPPSPRPPYQHFIPYSTFRESVQNSGIIIPRITEAANIALRYHESVISRPPGFGKTFLISILESLFLRDKSLFQRESHYTKNESNGAVQFVNKQVGYETNNDRSFTNDVKDILDQWTWNDNGRLNVLRFDFSTVLLLTYDDDEVHEALIRLIIRVAEMNHLLERTQLNEFIQSKKGKLKNSRNRSISSDLVLDHFLSRIEKLNEEYVILIDDADYIMRMTEDYSNRIVVTFYQTMLKHSKRYQFLLATCVFPTSIPFIDISSNPDISTILGFTIKDISNLEILDDFLDKLKARKEISRYSNYYYQTKSDILNEMEYLYGGYYFSPLSEYSVLNPICVIECIENFQFKNYWIEKALPWSEDTLVADFLNYFTIFRSTSSLLFNDVILKILKFPTDVDETTRDRFVFLRFFGLFTYMNNTKENLIQYQQGKFTTNCFHWKIPNTYIYEYLSDMMISYIQQKVSVIPSFLVETSPELCFVIRNSVQDKSIYYYYDKKYFDFFLGSVLSASGYKIRCHFSTPYLHLTAESAKTVCMINIYYNSDQNAIVEKTFKERFREGIGFSINCNKKIKLFVTNFRESSIQVLMCEPNLREILANTSMRLSAQFDLHEELVRNMLLTSQGQFPKNVNNAPNADKSLPKKKPSFQNMISNLINQRNSLNASLIDFLNRKRELEFPDKKKKSNDVQQTPNFIPLNNLVVEPVPQNSFLDQNEQIQSVPVMAI
ncbi:hypothetical protein M9Y10_025493 [Tritrichomonas musculus]|uniref:AAA-ATPase-like domain-containing protein n=1 Tax=Tritrichomonas musculus TaxID=1915356 RepID=A0ABR2H8U4_9EUKA